jgi:hypothetical protein
MKKIMENKLALWSVLVLFIGLLTVIFWDRIAALVPKLDEDTSLAQSVVIQNRVTKLSSLLPTTAKAAPLTKALPALDKLFSETYIELKQRADKGDPWAACDLAVELIRCRQAVDAVEKNTDTHAHLFNETEGMDKASVDSMRQYRAQLLKTADQCADVPDELLMQSQSYLAKASRAGLRSASYMYAEGAGFHEYSAYTLNNPEFSRWQQQTPLLIDNLLKQGDPMSVILLMQAHDQSLPSFLNALYPNSKEKHLVYIALFGMLRGETTQTFKGLDVETSTRIMNQAKQLHQAHFKGRIYRSKTIMPSMYQEMSPGHAKSSYGCQSDLIDKAELVRYSAPYN